MSATIAMTGMIATIATTDMIGMADMIATIATTGTIGTIGMAIGAINIMASTMLTGMVTITTAAGDTSAIMTTTPASTATT